MTTTLTHLSNDSLLSGIKELVHSERRLTTEIIHHLREILRRELHLKLGYNSLFTYMVEELKYCEGSAHRRISAMNLLNSIPMVEAKKVEEKINTGVMSLTTVAMVQDLVRHKKKEKAPMSVYEKLEVLQSIEGLSKRETEKVLIAKAPELVNTKEKERVLTTELTEIKIVLNEQTLAKLKRIKELRSHVNANPSYSELIDDMADQLLKKLDPTKYKSKSQSCVRGGGSDRQMVSPHFFNPPPPCKPVLELLNSFRSKNKKRPKVKASYSGSRLWMAPAELAEQQPHFWARAQKSGSAKCTVLEQDAEATGWGGTGRSLTDREFLFLGSIGKLRSRYIPTKLRRSIWQENHGRCSYKNPQTGKACNSTSLLQIDHIKPFAKNGATTPENLTLLCSNHNQMRAREEFKDY